MDTSRVIYDWTTFHESDRSRTHPLYKFIAPIGFLANRIFFEGAGATDTARWICIIGVVLQVFLTGLFVWQLTRSPIAACLAAIVAGVSLPMFVLTAIPDTAALSGICSLLPFTLALSRKNRLFTWREGCAWIAVGLLGYGITISQISFFLLGLAFRLQTAAKKTPGIDTSRDIAIFHIRQWALVMIPLAGLIWGLVQVQGHLFGGGEKAYKIAQTIQKEFKFVETDELQSDPLGRFVRLTRQFAVYDFFAPEPVIARWSPPRDDREFLSITLIETTARNWTLPQWGLLLLHGALWFLILANWRYRRDFLLPLVGIALQFLLHYIYGREFLIYALNWHPLLIALAFAGLRNTVRDHTGFGLVMVVYCFGLLANNLWFTSRVFEIYQYDFPVDEAFSIIEPPE